MFVPILAYHKVQNDFELGITNIKPEHFERQIQYLFYKGFRTISIAEYIRRKNIDSKKIIITFDDGYESVYRNAFQILEKYNFTATIFVLANFAGQWNSWDCSINKFKSRHCNWTQLNELAAAGWEIGSHTKSHFNLRTLSDKQLFEEVHGSKAKIEDHVRRPVQIISYPYGKYDGRVIECAKKSGYRGGCTLGQNYPGNEHFPYAMCRRGVYLYEPFHLFKVKLKNTKWSHCDDVKQRIISFCSQGSILLRYLKSH